MNIVDKGDEEYMDLPDPQVCAWCPATTAAGSTRRMKTALKGYGAGGLPEAKCVGPEVWRGGRLGYADTFYELTVLHFLGARARPHSRVLIGRRRIQVFDAEKGPLEKRIQRTFDQAVKDDIVDLRDTEYWFSTPEGGYLPGLRRRPSGGRMQCRQLRGVAVN